jgi:hypothetical protein
VDRGTRVCHVGPNDIQRQWRSASPKRPKQQAVSPRPADRGPFALHNHDHITSPAATKSAVDMSAAVQMYSNVFSLISATWFL